MSAQRSASADRPFGVRRISRLLQRGRSGLYAARGRRGQGGRRRGPRTALSDAQLTARIREILADSPFLGEGH